MGIAVGIDLGTTNSCAAVVQGERARVVENEEGRRVQPSIISFAPDGSTLAGWRAKDRLVADPANTFYSFKRLLGRDLESEEMRHVLAGMPYEIASGPDGIPLVSARGRQVTLPELSAMMLSHLKEVCAANLGVDIEEAVITVPANFNDVQRSSTKVAGRIAGFNVLRILNEPTAAALAYGFGGERSERIAVYDFGGGTFDITVIELMEDIFEVLSTAGDTYLGGDDFDEKVAEEMRRAFAKEHDIDLGGDPQAMQRVRSVAERIKCQLSSLEEVEATLRELAHGPGGEPIDFTFRLTRGRFEQLIGSLVERSLATCDEALKLAKLDRSSLDNLVLVGGTTRIPLVRSKVEEYFGRPPRMEINPDEVVAIGAAIHAYSLTGESLPENLPRPQRKRKKTMMMHGAGLQAASGEAVPASLRSRRGVCRRACSRARPGRPPPSGSPGAPASRPPPSARSTGCRRRPPSRSRRSTRRSSSTPTCSRRSTSRRPRPRRTSLIWTPKSARALSSPRIWARTSPRIWALSSPRIWALSSPRIWARTSPRIWARTSPRIWARTSPRARPRRTTSARSISTAPASSSTPSSRPRPRHPSRRPRWTRWRVRNGPPRRRRPSRTPCRASPPAPRPRSFWT